MACPVSLIPISIPSMPGIPSISFIACSVSVTPIAKRRVIRKAKKAKSEMVDEQMQ
ncbi:MAG: hypothetical protein MPW16_21085 (plasmid) [Candidatus Manganitrophus sp.]|nr:MAG: hypothetical protein MPW16_21085 [Candidatus Manganitrophus sp.]